MVKIRLARIGKKNRPHYRIVVMDSRRKRNGEVLDILGHYDPLREGEFFVDLEGLKEWLKKGAQMTPRVKTLVKLMEKKQAVSATSGKEETTNKEV